MRRELAEAGFRHVDVRHRARELRFTRERALDLLRARFASSFALMDDREYQTGLRRAEREMPDRFTATLPLLVVAAEQGTDRRGG